MNRDDLLKKCVDRGVADETSVGAVSHLFYVYLLSALQRGQRVEVPDFGTFGTRVVGVKRARKMPYFEVERELAEKVNERYRNMKYLVIGRYELIPVAGEEEYRGREAPYDTLVEQVGKEALLDTHREIIVEEYERAVSQQRISPKKEQKLMPTLNLKDEEMEEEKGKPSEPSGPRPIPYLREVETSGGGPSWLLTVIIAIVLIAALVFALNYFGVIRLWEKKETPPVQAIAPAEEPALPPAEEPVPAPAPTPTPKPAEKPKAVTPAPMGTGQFTVQVSSWMTMSKAQEEVDRLSNGGFPAFVEEGAVGGETWFRVRVGRYPTRKEAATEAARLRQMLENGMWVARVGS